MLNIFEFSHVKKISIGLCKYVFMNFSNHVSWPRHSKGKLVPVSFSCFLELMRKNKFELKKYNSYNRYSLSAL